MRTLVAALVLLLAATAAAAAMESVSRPNMPEMLRPVPSPDLSNHPIIMEGNGLVEDMAWEPEQTTSMGQKKKFTRLQTDELAEKLGFHDGKSELFRVNLKNEEGQGPALAGTFNGGAAKLVLRWKSE